MFKLVSRFISLLIALAAGADPAAVQAGLVGYWKLNGDVADSSGNGFNGALRFRSSTYPAFPPGRLGLAIDSTGGAYGEVPDASQLSALGGAVTIEAWINLAAYPPPPPPAQGGAVPIVGKWGPSGADDDEYTLVVLPDRKLYAFMSGSSGYFELRSTMELPLHTWMHVAVVLDTSAGQARLFINGHLDRVLATTVVPNRDTAMPVQIGYGYHEDSGPRTFPGLIDEVRIWNRARTQQEILTDMNGELGALRTIRFSNLWWYVRPTSTNREEPGCPSACKEQPCACNNYWSADNVKVEGSGDAERLRLKLAQGPDGRWNASGVWTVEPTGYGTYRFVVESPVNFADANTVLGLFAFTNSDISTESACRQNEMDVEFSRWGLFPRWPLPSLPPACGKYTVAPNCGWLREAHTWFLMPHSAGASNETTHEFTWRPDYVHFGVTASSSRTPIRNVCMAPVPWACPAGSGSWILALHLPRPQPDHNAHMNLWLFGGRFAAGETTAPTEVVIRKFQYDRFQP